MILVRLMGGLGNQMFQYAFGKSLALKHNVELKLDTSLLREDTMVKDQVLRNFDLDIFNVKEAFATAQEIERFNGRQWPGIVDKFIYKVNRLSGKYPLVLQRDQEYDLRQLNSIGENTCIVGRWQSEDYFKTQGQEIRKAFAFDKFVPNLHSRRIADRMKETMAVSVHVRRGDYVTHPVYSRTLGCLDKQYYWDAIARMNQRTQTYNNVKYYFISDDIDWCKANFGEIANSVFVEQEKNRTGYASDLWLLFQCNHAIISNSTFSWWGAWLAEKKESLVIAPERWMRETKLMPQNIIPERWLKIKNDFIKL